jgi:hypothetical protein
VSIALNKFYLLSASVLSYGFFSSPTPDAFGLSEAFMLMLLISSVSLNRFFSGLNGKTIRFYHISFIVFVLIGFLGSIFRADSFTAVARDMIPFIYVFIIVFVKVPTRQELVFLTYCCLAAAIAYCARYIMTPGVDFLSVGSATFFGDLNYYVLDPLVNFGLGFSIFMVFRAVNARQPVQATFFILCAMFILLSLSLILVRAPIILSGALILMLSIRAPLLLLIVAISIFFTNFAAEIIELVGRIANLIIMKFDRVGLNSKGDDLAIVLELISQPPILFLGVGFGGVTYSQAADGLVAYFHNFPSFMLFKFGILGFVFSLILVFNIFLRPLTRICKSYAISSNKLFFSFDNAIISGLLMAFSSSIFLQASYRSFSFGVLVLIALAMHKYRDRN